MRDSNFYKTFAHAYMLVIIVGFIGSILTFYLPIHLKNIGFNGLQIGMIFAVFSITGLLFVFHIGVFTDRVSIKKMVTLGILLISAFFLLFPLKHSLIWVLFLFFLFGLGYNMFAISMDSFILKKVTSSMGKMFGIYNVVKSIPAAIALLIGGYLLFSFDFNFIIKIIGLVSLFSIYLVKFIPNTRRSFNAIGKYFKDFLSLRVILFSIILFIFTLHWGVENVAYTLFLKENLNLNYIQMGWYMSIPIVFLALSAFFLGKRFDKGFSAKGLLLTAFILSGVGFVLMAITTNPFVSFFFRIVHELGDGAFFLVVFIGSAYFFTKKRIGGGYGLIALVTVLGRFAGSLIFSPIGSAYGYQWPHIICGIITFVCGFFILLFKKS